MYHENGENLQDDYKGAYRINDENANIRKHKFKLYGLTNENVNNLQEDDKGSYWINDEHVNIRKAKFSIYIVWMMRMVQTCRKITKVLIGCTMKMRTSGGHKFKFISVGQ